jgi:hypothetical protein
MIIPPFAGVTLVEYRDRIELTPIYWYREFVGLGRFKANEVGPQPGDDMHPFFNAIMGDNEIWVIASWRRYEDEREEALDIQYLDPEATETAARKKFDDVVGFLNMSKEKLEALSQCFGESEEALVYIKNRFRDVKHGSPDPKSTDDYDLYQARVKVLAGMQPKTVTLMEKASATEDPREREKIEREAVQAYFAEMAHYWTEDLVKEWQRSNPVGTEWMCEFARVWQEPKLEIDPINHELALNWLRRKYNLLTAEELSDAILVMTGQRLTPGTLKKRRERLGLTTKRPPGPRANSEE